jgi:hypothetical protein
MLRFRVVPEMGGACQRFLKLHGISRVFQGRRKLAREE